MKIKAALLVSILLISCQNGKNTNHNLDAQVSTKKQGDKQFFQDYFFKIDCPCRLKKEYKNSKISYKVYRCSSTDSETIYSFSITDLKEKLNEYKDNTAKEDFKKSALKDYESELKSNNINYTKPYIYGFKGLEYLIPKGEIYNKQAVFISNGFVYTFNVTSGKKKIDSLFSKYINSFELYHKSQKYGYSIQIPEGYNRQKIIGANVDLKYVNKHGGSVIMVVKKAPNAKAPTIEDLLLLPDSFWLKRFPYPEMKIIKKGKVFVDNTNGFFFTYIAKGSDQKIFYFYHNYIFLKNGYIYTLTTSCQKSQVSDMRPLFFKVSHSLKFPD